MKVICGVDTSKESAKALELSVRLAFPRPAFELIHVIERLSPFIYGEFSSGTDFITQVLATQHEVAEKALSGAKKILGDFLQQQGVGNTSIVELLREGTIATELAVTAASNHADLIAIGHTTRTRVEGALYGSVGRKLAVTAPCSILIARDKPVKKSGLRAVFATDHSPYANKCIELFKQNRPAGITDLTILTAYSFATEALVAASATALESKAKEWVEAGLERENQEVIKRLSDTPCILRSCVAAGDITTAIEDTMRKVEADILILGAQGHGFIERLMLGSVSFHQAVDGKHHTLIMRA